MRALGTGKETNASPLLIHAIKAPREKYKIVFIMIAT